LVLDVRLRVGPWPWHPEDGISRDPNVHVFPLLSITRAARILVTPLITFLLLAPVIICNFVSSLTARLVVVVVAALCLVAVLSSFTKATVAKLVVAGATYVRTLCPSSLQADAITCYSQVHNRLGCLHLQHRCSSVPMNLQLHLPVLGDELLDLGNELGDPDRFVNDVILLDFTMWSTGIQQWNS
jgi:hypothetical protein